MRIHPRVTKKRRGVGKLDGLFSQNAWTFTGGELDKSKLFIFRNLLFPTFINFSQNKY
jgi:hypothetical protein